MIINFSHQKGGTGKSTIAYHLAKAFEDKGFKTTIYDLDIQDTCIEYNNLRDIPKSNILNITEDEKLIEVIDQAKEDEIYIIDSGGFDSSLTRLAIMGADINITPIADKVSEILAITKKYSKILKEIEEATQEQTSTYVLLNRIHLFAKNFEHLEAIIEPHKQMKILNTIIRDRAIYDKALQEGLTVQEANTLKGHEDARYELNKLAEELLAINKEEK
ncbi:MAG: division plane positioning ATPase MipZ [Candidatus Desulfofervidus auxilii]|nr:division plane positioning ATPase MipZ [Candidatus Desulfofervidus auxilii]